MRIILLGVPGAGKGTQADLLAKNLRIPKISTGDMLRAEIANNTALGGKIKELINSGKLVPDDLILKIIQQRITDADCANGFLLDGFPRTIAQAQGLWNLGIDIDHVIAIEVADAEVIKRLTGRRVHLPSGKTYHLEFNPPRVAGKDDVTGEPLIQRDDDKEATVRQRLAVYHQQTEPLLAWYKSDNYSGKAKYNVVSGVGSIMEIQQRILEILSAKFRQATS